MAYCRFSPTCDLYVYESAKGITIHVADERPKDRPPDPPPVIPDEITAESVNEIRRRWREYNDLVKGMKRERIDLPYAGESFYDMDPEDAVELLREMRRLGYRFPEGLEYIIEKERR